MKCKFHEAWIGRCNKETEEGSEYCKEHSKQKCCICGGQAVKNCGHTMGLVCGFPLCDKQECFEKHGHLDGDI